MKAKYEGIGASAGGSISGTSQQETDFETIKLHTEGLDVSGEDSGGRAWPREGRESALPLSC